MYGIVHQRLPGEPNGVMSWRMGGCTTECDELCFAECFPSAALEEVEVVDFDADE
jgi:hypothetical protein